MKIDWTKVKEGLTYQDILKEENKKLKEENNRLNNIINNTTIELEILLQSEDFELIVMQLRNIVFRLKGGNKNE